MKRAREEFFYLRYLNRFLLNFQFPASCVVSLRCSYLMGRWHRDLVCILSLPKWSQQSKPGGRDSIQVSHLDDRDPSVWAIIRCLPRHVSREQGQKQNCPSLWNGILLSRVATSPTLTPQVVR